MYVYGVLPEIKKPSHNKTTIYRSFSHAGPTLWNTLPEDLRSTECMNKFKAHLSI